MSIALGHLDQVAPRSVWESESRDFTPWLASNLNLLGEALGLDLEFVQMEASVGSFCCDIEATETGTGRKVIIENQLEETDHRHLGQLLTYAAGLDAAVIIWISPDIREEHREAIDFLNRHTRGAVDFFAIALEVVRIGDSKPAVVFRLASSPNAWAKTAAAASTDTAVVSEKKLAYQAFYQGVIDELRTAHRFTNAKAGQPQSWYAFSSGVRGFNYFSAFAGKERLRAEIYVDTGDGPTNKRIFDFFEAKKTVLEAALGEPLDWGRLDDKRACRIALIRPATTIDSVATAGPEIQSWLVARLLKLKQVFEPYLKPALEAASAGEPAGGNVDLP